MNVLASARIAVRALRVNKLRSALTMLGIVIGVGAVITMVAVGAGRAGARGRADPEPRLEPHHHLARHRQPGRGAARGRQPRPRSPRTTPWPSSATSRSSRWSRPSVRGGAQVVYGNLNWSTTILGVTPEYFAARDWERELRARRSTQEEVDGASKVALLGQTVAREPVRRRRPARSGDPRSRRCPSP